MLPDEYTLYVTPDLYYIRPKLSSALILIDRVTQDVRLQFDPLILPTISETVKIYGIWGSIRLVSGYYLLVITGRKLVGKILGHCIWEVTSGKLLPYARSLLHLTDAQSNDEQVYCQMIQCVLSMEGFYYSTTFDLSHTQQRLANTGPTFKDQSLFERSDERFVWNRAMLVEWAKQLEGAWNSSGIDKSIGSFPWNHFDYCLPVIQGFVGIISNPANVPTNEEDVPVYAIISRRCVFRVGTRYNSRGVDQNGNASNTVETEQLLDISGHRFSFVQLRGSVPLYWSQKPNLRYKPTVLLGGSYLSKSVHPVDPANGLSSTKLDTQNLESIQSSIIRQHFNQLVYDYGYGQQVIINLLNQKGMEHSLGQAYAAMSTLALKQTDVRYESFDFHHECGSTRWDRLSVLLERLLPSLLQLRQFHLLMDKSHVVTYQTGTFRTNCIDCLDRTNVLQSMLAWCALEQALIEINLLHGTISTNADASTDSLLARLWPNFGMRFKSLWADNADYCSLQYTGTRALKTDFTRTGKRTIWGMLMDGYHSLIRYYMNNFSDGFRQDSMHLFLGQYSVYDNEGNLKPLKRSGNRWGVRGTDTQWRTQFLPLIFSFTVAMSILCIIFPTVHWTEQATYVLFWGTASILSGFAIFMYGEDFVDQPVFCPD